MFRNEIGVCVARLDGERNEVRFRVQPEKKNS